MAAQIKKENYDKKVKNFLATKAIFDKQYAMAKIQKENLKVTFLPTADIFLAVYTFFIFHLLVFSDDREDA